MTPEKLIKALETAKAGDRELDASVAEVVDWEAEMVSEFTSWPKSAEEALPPGWSVDLITIDDDGRFVCSLNPPYCGETEVTGTGSTPALAICAAAVIAGMVDRVTRGRTLDELGELANKELD